MVLGLSALWWRRIRGLWNLPDGRNCLRGKLGIVLMSRVMLSQTLIQFSVDGWSCVPCLLFAWGQTMVEVMEITVTSFKRSHACTATLSAPNHVGGHRRPTLPLENPGHWQASPCQSLVGSLLLSPGFWCTRFCLCPPRIYFPTCISSDSSMVGLMATSSKRAAIPKSASPRAPASAADHCWSNHHRRRSQFCLSLCGVPGSWCTRFVWALWASLTGMGFDSKCEFGSPTVLLGLLLCP